MNMESREDIFKTGRQSSCTDCWLRGSVGIYTHQPVSSRAAHGGGESLARLRWIRGDTIHVSHSCRLQEADRAHNAGPEVGAPPPANALSHTPFRRLGSPRLRCYVV